jgi:predicted component of type VI protein secretion system
MNETKLVLLPGTIYYDLSEQKYFCLYYPDYAPGKDNPYEELMDFLLEHIDTEDRKLADTMYRIYELSEEPCFTIEDALCQLDECGAKPQSQLTGYEQVNMAVSQPQPAVTVPSSGFVHAQISPSTAPPQPIDCMTDPGLAYEQASMFFAAEEKPMPAKKKGNLFYPIFAGLSTCGIAAVVAVYFLFELTSEEMVVLIGCAAVMGGCLMICVAAMVKAHNKRGGSQQKMTDVSEEKDLYDSYAPVTHPVELENVLSRNMDLRIARQQPAPVETLKKDAPAPETAQYGNTIFFETSDIAEYKLYALDKKNKSHIALEKFPCTVGKMAGCVDHVLSDDSVSRIHARFDRQDNHIFITDMNSTNGTYKNGLRMQPQETLEIEPGDEIRFGNLHYCYR